MAISPASHAPPAAPTPSQPVNTGTIVQLPPSLSAVQIGQLLDGVVAGRLAGARVLVETNSGALILRTSLPLPLNTAVTLRITTSGPRPIVTILPQAHPASPVAIAAAKPPAQATPAGSSGGHGTVVTATVVTANVVTTPVPRGGIVETVAVAAPARRGPTPAAHALASNLAPGTRISVRILATTPPGSAITAAATATPTAARSPGTSKGAACWSDSARSSRSCSAWRPSPPDRTGGCS